MTATLPLRVQLLGRFSVVLPNGERAGPWTRPTARRLVQLISLQSDFQISRGMAAEALFPNLDGQGAANALAKALSMARSAMGPIGADGGPALEADRSSIWFHAALDLRTDLGDHLLALEAALRMPPGTDRDGQLSELLRSTAAPLADEPYAEWAEAARRTLADARLRAALALARDRSAGHGKTEHGHVLSAWTGVAARDPASEEAAIALMRLYAESGQREQAIRAYVACVTALEHDLGASPSAQLEQAYAELVQAERVRDTTVQADWLWGRRLFGREAILRRLRRRLAATHTSRGPALLMAGPAGIGKSHLIAALGAELERSGWRLLLGRSVPGDSRAPYSALRQALGPLAADRLVSSGRAGRRLPLLRLLGLVIERDDTDEPPGDDQALLAESVAELLDEAAAQAPLALLLDDLQWADASMLSLLRRLVARPAGRRWAIVATARSDEPAAPVPTLGGGTERIDLPPLSAAATGSAVRTSLALDGIRPAPSQVAASVERSQGNAFFAIELARWQASDAQAPSAANVPDAIVQLLGERLAGTSAEARTLLTIVSLAGSEARHGLVLETLALLDREDARRQTARAAHIGLDELIAARLVIETAGRLTLVHPLLRDAAISTVNAIRRSAVHAALADALAAGATNDVRLEEAAARHRLAAFEAAHLRSYALAAAEAGFVAGQGARHAHAGEVAKSLLEGALGAYEELPPDDRRQLAEKACAAWMTIGNIELDSDDYVAAEAAYGRAAEVAVSDADRARVASAQAGIPYRQGDLAGALAAYRAGLAMLDGDDERARARLESDAAWTMIRLGQGAEALKVLERVAPILLQATDTHLRCRTCDRLAVANDGAGRPQEALDWFARGIDEARAGDDQRELMILLLHRAGLLGRRGRSSEALADLAHAARVAEAAGDRYVRSVIHGVSAETLEAADERKAALAEREAEIEILATINNPRHTAAAHAHRARLLSRLGRSARARAAAAAALRSAQASGDQDFSARISSELAPLLAGGKISGKSSA